MSVTHPVPGFGSDRSQFMPFVVAVAIVALTVALALAVTGLPH